MKPPVLTAVFILCLVFAPALVRAQAAPDLQLRLPHVFGDNMVLQAGTTTPVWGWAPAGQEVTVTLADQKVSAKAGTDGKWKIALSNIRNEYGQKNIVPSGPLFKSMKIDGSSIRISFDYAGGGLMVGQKKPLEPVREVKDGALQRFALAGEDRQWHWAQAKIDGTQVVVTSPQVPKPVAVRYGFTMNPNTCVLYNRNGLPASPFRTDNWFIGWGNY